MRIDYTITGHTFKTQKQVDEYITAWDDEKPDDKDIDLFREDNNRLGKYDFYQCVFDFGVSFQSKVFEKGRSVSFREVQFLEKTGFWEVQFLEKTDFWNAKFLKEARFWEAKFSEKAGFSKAQFLKEADFGEAKFLEMADFGEAKFLEMADFRYVTFKKDVNFANTTFDKLADFYRATFSFATRFYETDFNDTVVFSNTTFKELAVFHYTTVKRVLIVRDAKFKKGLNLVPLNILDNGYINIFNIFTGNFETDKSDTNIDDDGDGWKKISHKHKRETLRIIKHEFLKQNNKVEALTYQSMEMEAYREELKNGYNGNIYNLTIPKKNDTISQKDVL